MTQCLFGEHLLTRHPQRIVALVEAEKTAPDTVTLPPDTPIQAIQQEQTPGKRSPDGRFREYKYNREIARAVVEHLQLRGIDAELLVPEDNDIPLKERVRRANKITCQIGHPVQDTIVVSIHVNAAGNGKKWYNATGWCAYTYFGHSLSDELATCLYKAARKHLPGHKLRTDNTDGDPDFEAPFYLLKYTYAAAVLTENGFMDSELSLAFLESDEGKKAIIALHVDGILDFIEQRANEPL